MNTTETIFINLTKAFDTRSTDAHLDFLRKLGIPEKMLNVIISFRQEMIVSTRSSREVSDSFTVSNGMYQCCVLALLLFTLYFLVISETVFECVKGIKF